MKIIATQTLIHAANTNQQIGQLILDHPVNTVTKTCKMMKRLLASALMSQDFTSERQMKHKTFILFEQISSGGKFEITIELLTTISSDTTSGGSVGGYISSFWNVPGGYIAEPDEDFGSRRRRLRRLAGLYACLVRAGFNAPTVQTVPFPISMAIRHELNCVIAGIDPYPEEGDSPTPNEAYQPWSNNHGIHVPIGQLPTFFDHLFNTLDQSEQEWAINGDSGSGSMFSADHGLPAIRQMLAPTGNQRGYHVLEAGRVFHNFQDINPVEDVLDRLDVRWTCYNTKLEAMHRLCGHSHKDWYNE